jgi:ribonuclease H / adenosylcobalamin/alpha-ribazole phosphatase
MDLVINTDGASRGNPGPASYGYVIKKRDAEILHQEGEKIGINTNNVAEYTAVLKALEYVKNNYSHKGPHQIEVVADSLLIVSQLSGKYKLKSPHLKIIFDQIKILEMEVGSVTYRHVLRANNFLADRLANQALDK